MSELRDDDRGGGAEGETLPGLARVRARTRRAPRQTAPTPAAEVAPVARVLVDLPLAHLDRTFDYQVPQTMAEQAVPGARVKVRFAGQDADAYVLERLDASDHPGRLSPVRRVVSPEPVLTPQVAALVRQVARRYAGTRADVLRLAVPPRHATTEKQPSPEAPAPPAAPPDPGAWSGYDAGGSFVGALARGEAPRAVLSAAPGEDWPALLARAAAATRAAGRGVLICVPDGKDVARVDVALGRLLGEGHHVALTADSGPAARYRDFLAVSRGARRVVVGTRAAAFAPVADLGLVVIWDDGDDLYAEPRAPYPHTRDVLLLRAAAEDTAVLVGGFARTVEAEYLLATGWAREISAPRATVRERVRVEVTGASDRDLARDPQARVTRLPTQAADALRSGLASGPVLVQTPRAGYAPSLACERCRTPVRCAGCGGPMRLTGPTEPPACAWCGTADPAWSCRECGHRGMRAPVRGEGRTAEELGRSFPSTVVRTSGGDRVLASVPDSPAIVVATPGAEPVAEAGYAAVVLMDTGLALARLDLRTAEEALRRWMNAVALARPGGRAVAVGDPAEPTLQALVRWDPGGFARREIDERRSAHLPPASRLATVTGPPGAVDDALTLAALPEVAELLGPVPVEETGPPRPGAGPEVRAVIRVPRAQGEALSEALAELQRLRSARKLDPVRIQVDPLTL
ncbi:primosomal protein N' [Nocardioides donggukensis]|uniref:Probable replication restart protein PriA n=1 Tax=Nocardioides donggukensis TaxID=2774019 RepID=A0A927PZT6_9ACTN|nr:primosomal protein N' [Nocardioides donggukensis]MBD8869730.1 primosomal protein N' [Nocardioides donggukensis]